MSTTNPAARTAKPRRSLLAFRSQSGNLNHHLWLNNGCWWLHYTLHLADYTKVRIRRSLRTADINVARARRDAILAEFRDVRKEAA
jgi:hypothetical protein